MNQIKIASELSQNVPQLKLSCIECDVNYAAKNEKLWKLLCTKVSALQEKLKIEEISKMPAIASSRKAYKACGKDPARYRLSAEALLRRVVKRGEIYQVSNVVDVLNLVSVSSGFSIGGYDVEKIKGDIEFGIGKRDELYEGIGRGHLNIEFMPVFRDKEGAFGTPTSDSVRTCVNETTRRFLMIIIDYGASALLEETSKSAVKLLTTFAGASNFELKTISSA